MASEGFLDLLTLIKLISVYVLFSLWTTLLTHWMLLGSKPIFPYVTNIILIKLYYTQPFF